MKILFYKLSENILRCFSKYNLFWHLLAVALTYIMVVSGGDWRYFQFSRNIVLQELFFPAIILGGLLPIFVSLVLLISGKIYKSVKMPL